MNDRFNSILFNAACILTLALLAPFFLVGIANAMASLDEPAQAPHKSTLRDAFVCPGMHAEWIDASTVQCLKERP